jgi:hypothetical protein
VFTPVHASWLNQVEIYFSIVQRKVLTPGDFAGLADLEAALFALQYRYEKSAAPFRWTFTRADLAALMQPQDPRRHGRRNLDCPRLRHAPGRHGGSVRDAGASPMRVLLDTHLLLWWLVR